MLGIIKQITEGSVETEEDRFVPEMVFIGDNVVKKRQELVVLRGYAQDGPGITFYVHDRLLDCGCVNVNSVNLRRKKTVERIANVRPVSQGESWGIGLSRGVGDVPHHHELSRGWESSAKQ